MANGRNYYEYFSALAAHGVTTDDARALRRISMTLHRWHELECGMDHGCIERSDSDNGRPIWRYSDGRLGSWIPDRERGALKRLAAIMARYPTLTHYVQGDPRGASLYILRPGDVPKGSTVDSCYNRGIAVYR